MDRHVTEISAGCKQSRYQETSTQQDASSSSQKSVADVAFATRSKIQSPPTRSSEPSNLTVKVPPTPFTGKIRSSVQHQGIQYPPNLPKEILVKAVPMKGIQS